MKLLEHHDILNPELFQSSEILREAWEEVVHAIKITDWPHGSEKFTIYPESGKKRGEGNGVKLIKVPCMQALEKAGWLTESLPNFG